MLGWTLHYAGVATTLLTRDDIPADESCRTTGLAAAAH